RAPGQKRGLQQLYLEGIKTTWPTPPQENTFRSSLHQRNTAPEEAFSPDREVQTNSKLASWDRFSRRLRTQMPNRKGGSVNDVEQTFSNFARPKGKNGEKVKTSKHQ